MPTIDSRAIVDDIIDGNGFYPGDEYIAQGPVVRITEYTNAWGGRTYGAVYRSEAQQGQLDKYAGDGEYITDAVVIFEREEK